MARSALLNVMVQAAFKAGKSLSRDFGEVQNLQVSVKGPSDYVSQADRKAEKIVKDELMKARPTYGFVGEESDEIKGTDGAHRWIVDPLDGTTNFLHGIPQFAVSIALERNGEIVAAVVFNPATDELYTAEKGGGAFLNDRRLRVAARKELSDAVVICGVPHLAAAFTASFSSSCATSWAKWPGCAASALPRWTSPTSPLAAATASGSRACGMGHCSGHSADQGGRWLGLRLRRQDEHAGNRVGRCWQRIHPQGAARSDASSDSPRLKTGTICPRLDARPAGTSASRPRLMAGVLVDAGARTNCHVFASWSCRSHSGYLTDAYKGDMRAIAVLNKDAGTLRTMDLEAYVGLIESAFAAEGIGSIAASWRDAMWSDA